MVYYLKNRGPMYHFLFAAVLSLVQCRFAASLSLSPRRLAYSPSTFSQQARTLLFAAPKRLEENVSGILYVNDRCINCAACSNFAPTVFERNSNIDKHVVFKQPTTENDSEIEDARAALAACPVAAIRVENEITSDVEREIKRSLSVQPTKESAKPFPRSIFPIATPEGNSVDCGVYYLGHHNDASFGAVPYLAMGKSPSGHDISVMIDVPRFGSSAVKAVKSLVNNGPDYLFLTHVDDTADHNKWVKEFPNLKRIFHSGDLGRHNWIGDTTLEHVEILLRGETMIVADDDLVVWDIEGNQQPFSKVESMKEGEFFILHTPGHSPGSICLMFRPPDQETLQSTSLISSSGKVNFPRGILFTGDTYAWTTRDGGHMSGFPRYGNNLKEQASSIFKLASILSLIDVIAPGHGHPRFYLEGNDERKLGEMDSALEELRSYR